MFFPGQSSREGAEKGGKKADCVAIEGRTFEAERKVRRIGGTTNDVKS